MTKPVSLIDLLEEPQVVLCPLAVTGFSVNYLGWGIYLWAIACLILVAWKRLRGEHNTFGIYLWGLVPTFVGFVLFPNAVRQSWRESSFESAVAGRLDAALTVVFGMAAGVILARLAAPSLYGTIDNRLLRQDPSTRNAWQLIGAFALAGGLMGWQSMTAVGLLTALIGLAAAITVRYSKRKYDLADWVVWVWLAVLFYDLLRIRWGHFILFSDSLGPAFSHTLSALCILGLAIFQRRINCSSTGEKIPV